MGEIFYKVPIIKRLIHCENNLIDRLVIKLFKRQKGVCL